MNEKNKAAYDALFARAYKALKENNMLHENYNHPDERLHGIEEYFANMEYLSRLDSLFTMIPLDEAEFAINANTRSINAPKITVVQKDNNAEMLIFTIDRYFDFMDLAADDMKIRVQWILPSGRSEAQDFEFVDLKSVPGKIRLGWLLNDAVTSESGDVQYSVRFWKETQIDNENKVIYSFNTLPAKFTVSKALPKEADGNIYRPRSSGLFYKAIQNSRLPDADGILPSDPSFGEPGLNLQATANLKKDNTLTLMAQAVVADTGEITYNWYYTPSVDVKAEDGTVLLKAGSRYPTSNMKTFDNDGNEVEIKGLETILGDAITVEEYYEEVQNKTIIPYTTYYKQNAENPKGYSISLNPAEDFANGVKLYEMYTTYTINDTKLNVVGSYQVEATNKLANSGPSRVAHTKECVLTGPNKVTFTKDLPEKYTLTGNDTLSVTIGAQSTDAEINYAWAYSYESDKDLITLDGENNNSLKITNPGWYKVTALATLNRVESDEESVTCTVVGLPEAPTVTYGEVSTTYINNGIPEYKDANADKFILDVAVASFEGPAALTSDRIIYRWFVTPGTCIRDELTEDSDIVVSGLGTHSLEIKNPNSSTKEYWNFTCEVTNELGGNLSDPVEKLFHVFVY